MKKRIESAILLCAGLGTRLRPITDTIPKPLVRLLGVPLLQYHFDLLNRYGFKKVVLNVHHLADEFIRGVQSLDHGSLRVEFSDEKNGLLDSGGGIRTAAEKLNEESFVTLNGDIFFDLDLDALRNFHERIGSADPTAMVLVVRRNESDEKYREIKVASDTSKVFGVGDKVGRATYFTGAAVLSYERIRALPVSKPFEFVSSILLPAVTEGQVYAIESKGLWLDLGSPQLVFESHFALMKAIEDGTVSTAERAVRQNQRIRSMQWASSDALLSSKLRSGMHPFYVFGDHSTASTPQYPIVSYEMLHFDASRSVLSYAGYSIPCDESRLRLS